MNALEIARVLGGDVVGPQTILCPGPAHSPADRSLSVRLSPQSPDGILVFSHANDDWKICKSYVLARLAWKRDRPSERPAQRETRHRDANALALALWRETVDLAGTLAETYLARRGIQVFEGAADLRFHASCPFGQERLPCMVGLYRDVLTNQPRAIHRTALTRDGQKIDRRALGPKGGCAIKLTPDENISYGLAIAEGIETALAGAMLLYRPVWCVGDKGGIAQFPLLSGIESLTILVDHDANDAGPKAALTCSQRWIASDREVFRVTPQQIGADIADLMRKPE